MTTQEQLDNAILRHAMAVMVRRAGGFVKITQEEIDSLDGGVSFVMDFERKSISFTAQQEKGSEEPILAVKN